MDSQFIYTNPEASVPGNGPLQGISIAVQPTISVKGWLTDAGSKALSGFQALDDAAPVERLKQAGASICGSTRTSEFGFGLHGSAAGEALSREKADAELVMDTAGESRMAAAGAGVFGFKPSYGIVSRFGLIGLIPSMEGCGILAETPDTIRRIMGIIAGQDDKDYSLTDEILPDFSTAETTRGTETLATIREAQDSLTDEQKNTFRLSLEELNQAGFTVQDVSMPEFPLFSTVHRIIGSVEASSSAGRYDSVRYGQRAPGAKNWNEMYLHSRGDAFGQLVKSYLFQGAYFQFDRYEAYDNACRIRARLVKEMRSITAQADFLVLPAGVWTPSETIPTIEDMYAGCAPTLFANVTGQPSLFVPSPGASRPGFQITGPRLSDEKLLSLGTWLLNNTRGGRQ